MSMPSGLAEENLRRKKVFFFCLKDYIEICKARGWETFHISECECCVQGSSEFSPF